MYLSIVHLLRLVCPKLYYGSVNISVVNDGVKDGSRIKIQILTFINNVKKLN